MSFRKTVIEFSIIIYLEYLYQLVYR